MTKSILGYSTLNTILCMVEPAAGTASICLPSIWSLMTYGFKKAGSLSFRRFSPKRSTTLVKSGTKSQDRNRANSDALPIRGEQNPAYVMKSTGKAGTSETSVDGEERASSISDGQLPVEEERVDERRWPLQRPMEMERRVRGYYDRTAFDHGSSDTTDRDWVRTKPLRGYPLPGPPKVKMEYSKDW